MRAVIAISWKYVPHVWNFERRRWDVVANIALGEEHRMPENHQPGAVGEAIAHAGTHPECLRDAQVREVPEPDSPAANMHRMNVLATSLLM